MAKKTKQQIREERQLQEYNARVNKATIELAEIGGYIEHATKLISLQYLVGSMVATLQAELDITFKRANIKSNKIVSIQNALDKAVDEYLNFFKGAMGKDTTLDYFGDLEKLEIELYKWANIKTLRPKRKAMREAIRELEIKHNVKLEELK